MTRAHATLLLCLVGCLGLMVTVGARGASPASAEQVDIQQLQLQVDDLSREFARLDSAPGPEAQHEVMQRHWGMMLNHLLSTRMMPGMSDAGCTDWTMMDSNVVGPGMMRPAPSSGCGMLGHGMMENRMLGNGVLHWRLPSSMAPDAYQHRLQDPMQGMHQQMAAIAAEKDSVKRQALIREHYDTMYRDIQTMRGMGWMWTPSSVASVFTDPSPHAQLVATYCSQCHAAPSPSLHRQTEWLQVTSRMRGHIYDRAGGAGAGIRVPSAGELETIEDYLVANAARAH